MYRTLFFIPHEIASIPIFGVGWMLGILMLAFAARFAWVSHVLKNPPANSHAGDEQAGDESSPEPPSAAQIMMGEASLWAVAASVVVFLFPNVELRNIAGEPLGMAIRGYGVFLLCGVASAIGLAAYRVKRDGMDPELIYSLAPWVLIAGIGGARLFYVIQYRDSFTGETTMETLRNMLAFTEGGLVVYGSFIGGFVAFLVFVYRKKIPVLRFGDAIVPCIFLGVFFGRLGCLMNGCCYGGRCEEGFASLRFPANTEVYHDQLRDGELLGMDIDSSTGKVRSVIDSSIADELGVKSGDRYSGGNFAPNPKADELLDVPKEDILPGWWFKAGGNTYVLGPDEMPARTLPVRAAQPISSVSSLVLCIALCSASLLIKRPGVLMFIGFAAYAVLRFILEIVRVDEGGQFNTTLSISQWVSIVVFTLSVGGLVWLLGLGGKVNERT